MAPRMYLEDFTPGSIFELGEHQVTEGSIVTFAREWDPQEFHVDAEKARTHIWRACCERHPHVRDL